MQGRAGTQFFLVALCYLEAVQNVVLICIFFIIKINGKVPEERSVFLRDQASSLYSISSYFASKVIAELPLNLLTPLLALCCAQWPWNLNDAHPYNFWVNRIFINFLPH